MCQSEAEWAGLTGDVAGHVRRVEPDPQKLCWCNPCSLANYASAKNSAFLTEACMSLVASVWPATTLLCDKNQARRLRPSSDCASDLCASHGRTCQSSTWTRELWSQRQLRPLHNPPLFRPKVCAGALLARKVVSHAGGRLCDGKHRYAGAESRACKSAETNQARARIIHMIL